MSHFNETKSNNHNPNPPKKDKPGYTWTQVGMRTYPMQATHLETPPGKTRCQNCWRVGVTTPTPGHKGDHFCRWNIEQEGAHRDPNPKVLYLPVYGWVKD